MRKSWRVVAMSSLALCVGLAGCQLAALFAGHGTQPALYTFPKNQRVLVFVDAQEAVSIPPGFDSDLAEKINQHLYANKATDHIVTQDRLMLVKDKYKADFKNLGLADIADKADADIVLSVYITHLSTPMSADGLVGQGDAEAFVKVVDRQGKRLWPGDPMGIRVDAHEDQVLTSDRPLPLTLASMIDQLQRRTGRMFHSYSLDDKTMLR